MGATESINLALVYGTNGSVSNEEICKERLRGRGYGNYKEPTC